ncbi:D-allose ABC transporter permease [Escherichia coli]|nr:D-allose ABC transporter permease [Escherichia coli]ATX13014.1 hypothetical protein CU077_02475 [Escherichia coli]MCI4987203.1 D-allose ABC transporter permease [Escherichia coli]HCQ0475809.1 D-allose ABC transporter permease [Escherichia coli]
MGFTTRVKSEASEKKPFNFALFWDKYGTFFILAIIVAIFGSLSPEYFLTTNNITQIFVQSSVTVLIGMGEFFAILVAGIDLSVGAILALSGMVTAKLMLAGVDPFLAALIGGVLVGGALGAINGCLVNWTGLHPFIITLGTNAIFRGITLVISDANSVYGFSFDFVNFFAASVIGIPVPVIFSLIVALILWFLTTRMRLGRNIYALGGNKNSAFYSGIDVKFHILVVFIISGVCAGLAGVVSTARLGAAEPLAGMGFETYAIASAIIGGTSFFGGKGRIFSVVIGGLIIGTINNGLNILQVQTYYQLVVMGGLIIAAVALDRLISNARTAQRAAEADLNAVLLQAQSAASAVSGVDALVAQRAAVEADIALTKLHLEMATVRAPFDGRVISLKTSVGQFASAMRPIFTLIDTRHWYVIANFRETDLKNIRSGTPATIRLMSDSGKTFEGKVDSIGYGVLPDDGGLVLGGLPKVSRSINWVRVAQRFPVKIMVEKPDPEMFRIGASAVANLEPQ